MYDSKCVGVSCAWDMRKDRSMECTKVSMESLLKSSVDTSLVSSMLAECKELCGDVYDDDVCVYDDDACVYDVSLFLQ